MTTTPITEDAAKAEAAVVMTKGSEVAYLDGGGRVHLFVAGIWSYSGPHDMGPLDEAIPAWLAEGYTEVIR